MYCPQCANPIDDNQKFCRSCGANVSLVPQALTGQLPVVALEEDENTRHGRRKHRKVPTIEGAIGKIFSGIGFIIAACFITFWFPGGFTWGWSFFIPAFALIGEGIGHYLKLKENERKGQPIVFQPPSSRRSSQPNFQSNPQPAELSAPTTSELQHPSSITENTTKHLKQQR